MAKANLKVEEELIQKFKEVSRSGTIAYLRVDIVNETCTLASAHNSVEGQSLADVWPLLADEANEADRKYKSIPQGAVPVFGPPSATIMRIKPLIWLVNLHPNSTENALWNLVSWVPDSTHPKAKMLFASARDDIKRSLGPEFFNPDYHVTEIDELSDKAFSSWSHRDRNEAMSQQEKVNEETIRQSNQERSTAPMRMTMVGQIPFKVDDNLFTVLSKFKNSSSKSAASNESTEGDSAVEATPGASPSSLEYRGWVEISIQSGGLTSPGSPTTPSSTPEETFVLVDHGEGEVTKEFFAERIAGPKASSEPRFYLATPTPPNNGSVVLFYHCPEGSKPKQRMLYSTGKSSLTQHAGNMDIIISKTVESRDRDDVESAFDDFVDIKPVKSISAEQAVSKMAQTISPIAAAATSNGPKRFGGFALPGMGVSPRQSAAVTSGSNETADAVTSPVKSPIRGGFAMPGMVGAVKKVESEE